MTKHKVLKSVIIIMLNYIWCFMIIIGAIVAIFTGNMGMLTEGVINSSKDAIELCIVMLGVVGMWNGVLRIANDAGLIKKWTKGVEPIISFLFPRIPKEHPVREDIATNLIANVLGLGLAATPAGLRAMKKLDELNRQQGRKGNVASNEMCIFLIINISSLQLIPVNIIAYRSKYGAMVPEDIIIPAIIATFFSTLVAVVFCKIADLFFKKKN